MDELSHECGIAAVYHLDTGAASSVWAGDPDKVSRLMPRMLLDLQNRGQLAAGMTTYRPDRDRLLDTYKDTGPVAEAFRMSQAKKYESIVTEYAGRAAIGHVRYATCGPTGRSYAQPFERRHGCKWKWFAFGFNGNLANLAELRTELLSLHDYHLTRDNDTEVIMHFLAHAVRGDHRPDWVEVFTQLERQVRRVVQPRLPERPGRHDRPPRPARPAAAVLRRRRPGVRRRQRERGPVEPRVQGDPLARAGRDDSHLRWRDQLPPVRPEAAAAPIASSSGSTSPTWPARSTTGASTWPGPGWARNSPAGSGNSTCSTTRTGTPWSCPCPTPARRRPTRWHSSSASRRSRA